MHDVLQQALLLVPAAMPMKRAEPTPLFQCIEEQEYSSPEEREQVLAEVRKWLEEHDEHQTRSE